YFKDRTEQVKVIGEGPRLSETETDLYRELRQRATAEVVFLQEFNDEKIQGYLRKARPKDHASDWQKIQQIYNLKDLATRPLLLDMVVKTLPKLKPGEEVNAAKLYNVYTNIWIAREEDKGRKFRLDAETKLALMMELAWRMWREEKQTVYFKELAPFVQKLVDDQKIEIGDEEIADIASEMQGASFLKRDDAGNFSFMHRSFGEFFLAKKINNALSVSSPTVKEGLSDGGKALADARATDTAGHRVGSPTVKEGLGSEAKALADARATDTAALHELLNTRRYDQKTIFFLAQLDEADAMREPLQDVLRNKYQARVSENALQLLYWSARIRCGMEEEISDVARLKASLAGRIPVNANLVGAKLQEVFLECADLTGIDLTEAELRLAKLNYVSFDNAVFRGASLVGATVENASAVQANFREANVDYASFNDSDLTRADFTDAQNWGLAKFLRVKAYSVEGIDLLTLLPKSIKRVPIVQFGANSALRAVSYRPNGLILAAGGDDGVIHIYRLEDGA
ncbi:MAG: NACHT domain-containing protein, partial [Blastocatellia bacterium]